MINSEKDTLNQILVSGPDNDIIHPKSSTWTTTSNANMADNEQKCFCANSVLLNIHQEINNDLDLGQIPHIDSDAEDDFYTDHKRQLQTNRHGIITPTKITDMSEKLLLAGIYLPGMDDVNGHPVIFCDAVSVLRATLTRYEIATLLLYYSSIIRKKRRNHGLTLLIDGANENVDHEWRVTLDILDKALFLIQSQISIKKILVWHRRKSSTTNVTQLTSHLNVLMSSNIPYEIIGSEKDVLDHIREERLLKILNVTCGSGNGSSSVDPYQKNWVNFYRNFEPVFGKFVETGRKLMKLLIDLQQLKQDEVAADESGFLEDTRDKIDLVLNENELKDILSADRNSLIDLKQLAATGLQDSKDVQFSINKLTNMSNILKKMYGKSMQISRSLRNHTYEFQRFKSLELEAKELSSWLQKSSNQDLSNHAADLKLAADLTSIRLLEKNFEKFYFTAMKYLKKVNDVVEEGKQFGGNMAAIKPETKSLYETVVNLKEQSQDFSKRLELTREQLEDAVHCFNLLECHDEVVDNEVVDNEIVELAPKTGNVKLLRHCESIRLSETISMGNIMTKVSKQSSTSTSTSTLASSSISNSKSGSELGSGSGAKCGRYDSGISAVTTLSSRSSSISASTSSSSVSSSYLSDDIGHQSALQVSHKMAGRYKHLLRRKVDANTCLSSRSSGTSEKSSDLDDFRQNNSSGLEKSDNEKETSPSNMKHVIVNSHLHRNVSNLKFPFSRALNVDRKTQKTIVLIMREMIQTERDYVQSLNYVMENYLPELDRDDIPQILRGQRHVIFGNIVKIFEFHSESFLKDLEMCESNPLRVGRIFLKHSAKFYLYALYNKNKPKSDRLMAEYASVFFQGKQLELGDKMDLASYLLKPVQRMGKYALLLQEFMKTLTKNHTDKPTSRRILNQIEDLISAEEMVRFQLRHGNDLLAMDSIRDCDLNLKEQGRLLRQNEFLVWEGKNQKKSLRQVFLFDELILFTKAKRLPDHKNLDLYMYKNSMKMTDIGLTEQVNGSETKFEVWFRKRKPNDIMFLQAMSPNIKNAWTEDISQLLWKQATRNREVRLAEMFSMGIGHKPCLDIRPSANQISDRSITFKQLTLSKKENTNSLQANHLSNMVSNVDGVPSSGISKRPYSIASISSCSSSSTSGTMSKVILRDKQIFNSHNSVESGICADSTSIITSLSEESSNNKTALLPGC